MKESNVQLIGKPRIRKVSFETNNAFVFDKDIELDIDNNVTVLKACESEICEAQVILQLSVFKKAELEEVPFQVEIEIEGLFSWDQNTEGDSTLLERALRQNAPAVLYSYIRPIVTNLTVEANMPPLVLPLMNFTEK